MFVPFSGLLTQALKISVVGGVLPCLLRISKGDYG